MRLHLSLAALLAAAGLSPVAAVGLGPLTLKGDTLSERKGFYLTLINPYPTRERFRLYSIEFDGENAVPRVLIPMSSTLLGAKSQSRVLVVDTGLVPGETHKFRVCAERVGPSGEALIHARVCAKLTARRRG